MKNKAFFRFWSIRNIFLGLSKNLFSLLKKRFCFFLMVNYFFNVKFR